ncbi:MAG: FAD-dependent oxidoreductase [Planctomycetota bacterium]
MKRSGYDFSGAATKNYVEGIVKNWIADPFVRGSYSFPTQLTYTSTEQSERKTLRKPVVNMLFFAGEATNHDNPATVPGAVEEGLRAAKKVDAQLRALE